MTTTAAQSRRDDNLMRFTFTLQPRSPGKLPPRAAGEQVGFLRHRAVARLDDRGLARVADDAALVVSELVTNAIVHSGSQEITLSLSLRDSRLRIDVHDGVPSYQQTPHPLGDADEHGRGLTLVGSIADDWQGDWGVSDGGATTWCELNLAVR